MRTIPPPPRVRDRRGALLRATWLVLLAALAGAPAARAVPAATSRGTRTLATRSSASEPVAERTIRAAVEVSREGARLVAYTLKERPFRRPGRLPAVRPHEPGGPLQLELVQRGSGDEVPRTHRVMTGPICLEHGPDAPPHIEGDTILLHRETFIVELPEVRGLDRLELAYYERERGLDVRRTLGTERLDLARFTPAGGPLRYGELRIAVETPAEAPEAAASSSGVLWPEDFGDDETYRVWGDPAESDSRITIVMVPDGYTYAEKALMEEHAANMVQHFRAKTPYAEHDLFINYVLVYAYSAQSGTDECDCGVFRDTAMGTRFPDAGQPCGNSANRCLYYGSGCDTDSTANIAAAELRAPSHDTTIVLVNTTRYGGCGGYRAVVSAGNSQANEVAVHELGHSLAGLADEYGGNGSCGSHAGEINTSSDPIQGAWPEWIDDLGAPVEGAQYYDNCLYRPAASCEMRALNRPFCPVCTQRWALTFFSHPRIAPTAPLRAIVPAASTQAYTDVATSFAVDTRLPGGTATHRISWSIRGPGETEWAPLAQGGTSLEHTFDASGLYELRCEIVADTNLIKPSRYGPNVDTATWTVEVSDLDPPGEVAPAEADTPLRFTDKSTLAWAETPDALVQGYNLYRGELADLPAGKYGSCLASDIPTPSASDAQTPSAGSGWSYLISATNPAGEGPLGTDALGGLRSVDAACP